jgi:hypothetical protein
MEKGCSCRKWGGKPCSFQFTLEYVRLSCKELSKHELDMYIMGELVAFFNSSDVTSSNKKLPYHSMQLRPGSTEKCAIMIDDVG